MEFWEFFTHAFSSTGDLDTGSIDILSEQFGVYCAAIKSEAELYTLREVSSDTCSIGECKKARTSTVEVPCIYPYGDKTNEFAIHLCEKHGKQHRKHVERLRRKVGEECLAIQFLAP